MNSKKEQEAREWLTFVADFDINNKEYALTIGQQMLDYRKKIFELENKIKELENKNE
jgi:hypothetical protein